MDFCDIANLFTTETSMKDKNITDKNLYCLKIRDEGKKLMAEYLINSPLFRYQGKLNLNYFRNLNMYPILIKRDDEVELYEGKISRKTDRETLKALFEYCHNFFEDMKIFDTIPEQILSNIEDDAVPKQILSNIEDDKDKFTISFKSTFGKKDDYEDDYEEDEEEQARTEFNKKIDELLKLYNAELQKEFGLLEQDSNISKEILEKQKYELRQNLTKKYKDMQKKLSENYNNTLKKLEEKKKSRRK